MIKSIFIVLLAEILIIALCYIGFKIYKGEPFIPFTGTETVVVPDTLKLEAPADPVETGVSSEVPDKTEASTPTDTLKVIK